MLKCSSQYFHLSCEGSSQKWSTARDHPLLFRVTGAKDTLWESHRQACKSRLLSYAFKANCTERGVPISILNLPVSGLTVFQGRQHKLSASFCCSLSLISVWMINCFIFLFALLHFISDKCFSYSAGSCTCMLRCFSVPQLPAAARWAARRVGSLREFAQRLQLPKWIIKGNTCLAFKAGQNCKARDKTPVWPYFLFASVMSKAIWECVCPGSPCCWGEEIEDGKANL